MKKVFSYEKYYLFNNKIIYFIYFTMVYILYILLFYYGTRFYNKKENFYFTLSYVVHIRDVYFNKELQLSSDQNSNILVLHDKRFCKI